MLFFNHIPKTGGQTVAARIASAFLPERVHILDNLRYPQDNELLNNLCKTKDFVGSHVLGPLLAENRNLQLLTVIRNPIDRLISSYRHVLREPRDGLHRAALQMTPLAFFKNYADTLSNGQITTLVEAMFSCPDHAKAEDKYQRWLLQHFNLAIDQIDFLVPFERIDEFVTLWSAQTGRWVPQADQILNEAPPDNVDIHAIRDVIQQLPYLYSLDVELWRAAQSWFSSYRKKVLSWFTRTTEPMNSSVAFFDESSRNAVLLTRGWYPPLCHPNGNKEWWAGPQRASEIEVRRNFHSGRLTFEITVVIGIDLKDVIFLSKSTGKRLNVEMAATKESTTSVHVDIGELREDDTIVVVVPKVYSPIQIHEYDNDPTRRSFATTGWRLADGPHLDEFTSLQKSGLGLAYPR